MRRAGMLAVALAVVACDAKSAFVEPHPTLARMQRQAKTRPYAPSPLAANDTAMRAPPEGTVPRERSEDSAFETGIAEDGEPIGRVPLPVDRAFVERGRQRFDIVCATCHGITGDGDSIVATKMELRRPPSLLSDEVRGYPPGRLYRIVREGYGLMPSLASVVAPRDRWAIVTYVRALQRSRGVALAALPEDVRKDAEAHLR